MPIYIIFNDKTFIDMSAKAPEDGEAKYDKYGERFIRVIVIFPDDNPRDCCQYRRK